VEGFPALLDRFRQEWDVVTIEPFFDYIGYAWVAPCVLRDGTKAVLKFAPPEPEVTNEARAMRLYDGRGAARVLAADEAATALLLERLEPGDTLASLKDDVAATEIAAETFARLYRALPAGHPFPSMLRWGRAFEQVREKYDGGCGAFPRELFDTVERIYAELCASQDELVLVHGDLHHYNILRSGDGWLAIDPKGIAGERAAEIGPYLYNRTEGVKDLRAFTVRRIAQFSDRLGVDRQRLVQWGFALAVLSTVWMFQDDGRVPEGHLAVARALLGEIRYR
jgi:streptomycin 6-kinase